MKEGAVDGLLAAAHEWFTKLGGILYRTSWTMEDAMALMAG